MPASAAFFWGRTLALALGLECARLTPACRVLECAQSMCRDLKRAGHLLHLKHRAAAAADLVGRGAEAVLAEDAGSLPLSELLVWILMWLNRLILNRNEDGHKWHLYLLTVSSCCVSCVSSFLTLVKVRGHLLQVIEIGVEDGLDGASVEVEGSRWTSRCRRAVPSRCSNGGQS